MNEIESRADRMDRAFDEVSERPGPLVPVGQVVKEIHQLPRGAIKVEVPRDLARVKQNIKTLASIGGSDFYYRWPVDVTKKDYRTGQEVVRQEWIEGPSVKLANSVAREYGNCFAGVTEVEDRGDHYLMEAQFVDFQSGYVYRRFFQQRKKQNVGKKMDAARAQDIVFQIGQSKAIRNVVTNALSDFVDFAFEIAKKEIVDSVGKNMNGFKQKVLQRLNELSVDRARVERLIGKPFNDWLAPDVARVIAEIQAINDGMADPDEMWPRPAIEVAPEQPKREQYEGRPSGPTEAKPAPAYEVEQLRQGGFAVVGADRRVVVNPDRTARVFETEAAAREWIKAGTHGSAPAEQGAPAETRAGTAPEAEGTQPEATGGGATQSESTGESGRSPGYEDGIAMIEIAEENVKAGEVGNTEGEIEKFRDAMKMNINNLPDISDEERAELHGKWSTVVVNAIAAARKGRRKGK